MFCVRPRMILMGEKNITRGALEAMTKMSISCTVTAIILGTPTSALSAVERCQCATTTHVIFDITSSYARFSSLS